MNAERPYLTERRCGTCLVPLEISEHREGGWLFTTYRCPACDFKQAVTFSPQELAEWASRKKRPVGERRSDDRGSGLDR